MKMQKGVRTVFISRFPVQSTYHKANYGGTFFLNFHCHISFPCAFSRILLCLVVNTNICPTGLVFVFLNLHSDGEQRASYNPSKSCRLIQELLKIAWSIKPYYTSVQQRYNKYLNRRINRMKELCASHWTFFWHLYFPVLWELHDKRTFYLAFSVSYQILQYQAWWNLHHAFFSREAQTSHWRY